MFPTIYNQIFYQIAKGNHDRDHFMILFVVPDSNAFYVQRALDQRCEKSKCQLYHLNRQQMPKEKLSSLRIPMILFTSFTRYHKTRTGLRSALDMLDTTRLSVPKFRKNALQSTADKSFSLAVPALWNKLPISIRTSNSISSFKRCLKTHLFPQ